MIITGIMLVMLCTRCQQREARAWPVEKRARFEKNLGIPWPFTEELCKECLEERLKEWLKDHERWPEFNGLLRAIREKNRKEMERLVQNLRSGALKVLDVADAIAGKL
ncbi:MAG TPA: hypothetical protein VFO67_20270 [Gemmatimonadales bacterium]|nr:hypothetical protein [Gemmatimonadales bacterium]